MTTPTTSGWFSGRTKLITFASVAAVAVAGAIAVGANLGILNAAADTNVGSLSATGDTAQAAQVVYVDDPAPTTAAVAAGTGSQQFSVDAAGTVSVSSSPTSMHLDSVAPTSGWTWSLAQTDASHLTVTFTDGTRTLEFVAEAGADGTVAASVNEPIATAAASANNGDDESEHEEHEEYEGGEDDD